MKKIILGVVALTAVSAFAGLPDEDPVIATLRSDFYDGQMIDSNNITGKIFRCKSYSAIKNNYDQDEFRISFEKLGRQLRQRYTPGDRKHPSDIKDYYFSDGVALSDDFGAWGGTYLLSSTYSKEIYANTSFKINQYGELLQEFSVNRILVHPFSLNDKIETVETLSPLTKGLSKEFKVNQYSRCFVENP